MKIKITQKGDFKHAEAFLKGAINYDPLPILRKYGEKGCRALSAATPKDSGETAASWEYKIEETLTGYRLHWINTNSVGGMPIVILIQYGHGTKNGGYVQPKDFINPALKPVLDELSDTIAKEASAK